MRNFTVHFTEKSQLDLAEILSYIAEDNLENAILFTEKIYNSINDTLSVLPLSGTFYGTKQEHDVRTLVVHKSYTVFYVILEQQEQVEVIKIFNTYTDNVRFHHKLKKEGIIKSSKNRSSKKH